MLKGADLEKKNVKGYQLYVDYGSITQVDSNRTVTIVSIGPNRRPRHFVKKKLSWAFC